MLKCVENCGTRQRWCLGPDVKKFSSLLNAFKFFQETKFKKFTIEPNSYTEMLLYLFFDSLLSTCQKKWKLKNCLRLPTLPYIFIYRYDSLKTITAVLIREAWKGKP